MKPFRAWALQVWPMTLEMLATRARNGGAAALSDVSFSTAIGACENGMQQHLALRLLWDAEAMVSMEVRAMTAMPAGLVLGSDLSPYLFSPQRHWV